MNRIGKWKYRLGALLLAAGLLTGCEGEIPSEASQPQIEENQAAVQEADMHGCEEEQPEVQEVEEEQPEVQEVEEEQPEVQEAEEEQPEVQPEVQLSEEGSYTSKEEVAAYINLYGHLPDNFITKKEAKKLGWVSQEGNLGEVAPGKSIGGDYFGNYEGNLPQKEGRDYHECDIDSDGGYRGAKRIVYSNDGLIYYTEDHYETFELLYGEE